MGLTIAEKVLTQRNVADRAARAGDMIDARVDGLMVINYERVRAAFRKIGFHDGPPVVFDPDRVFVMNDHFQPPMTQGAAQANRYSALDANRLALRHHFPSELGISHQMMLDHGLVRPGELVLGADSHSISYGAVNAVATGIGTDEVAYVFTFGELFLTVPETIKLTLTGAARPYPFGKDVILYLAGRYGDSFAQDQALEFHGAGAAALGMSERITLADHAVEVGAKFGVFLADEKTDAFMQQRTEVRYSPVAPDVDARYVRHIELDMDQLEFQVARPFTFDNVVGVGALAGTRVNQARIGSCANGRFEDIEIAARMLRGRKVAPNVQLYISPASNAVYRQCLEAGVIVDLVDAGAQVMSPGCTICQSPSVVLNDEVCITATTRNYRGRFGGSASAEAQIYLAGPATVAAAAIAGEIVDPREFLGV